ncbi:hypothetical protein [Nitriliruptor alkaliphilus]|uniref:hypothetical protein n=1 Tax=Nitriliruptor alkaliphilus TaxID=427918 RepID=UPI0006972EE0|nr:hypothetical protein [Nitriliruptor alkaliphilus]
MTAVLVGALSTLAPTMAAADPAGPTNYESRVSSIEPAVDGLEVEVLGGDAYVQVSVPPGSTATVAGYDPSGTELYLRFLPEGTVERNEASPTRWLNDERYGAEVPPEASAEAPPRWEVVATGGTYAWHDHRVHWMSPEPPGQLDTGADEPQLVQTWTLQLTVDDQPVEVAGELHYLPSPSPVPPVAVLVLVLGAGVALALRRPTAVPLLALAGAVAAAVVGAASVTGLPPGADSEPALLILPGVALVLLLVAVAIRGRPGIGPRLIGALAGLPLVVWGVLLIRSLVVPIVPTALPNGVARVLVAVVLGTGLASLVAAARLLTAPPPPRA